jgi:hypothetical protein
MALPLSPLDLLSQIFQYPCISPGSICIFLDRSIVSRFLTNLPSMGLALLSSLDLLSSWIFLYLLPISLYVTWLLHSRPRELLRMSLHVPRFPSISYESLCISNAGSSRFSLCFLPISQYLAWIIYGCS